MLCLAKNSLTLRAAWRGACRGAETRYQKTICEAASDELHLEGVAERLCRQSDSWSGIGEETHDAPDPPCQHVAPSTHPFHNMTEGQTRLHYRSTHSWLSQAAIRSSGMWRQMLPSILHGCHFDTISSFSKKFCPRYFRSGLVVWFKWHYYVPFQHYYLQILDLILASWLTSAENLSQLLYHIYSAILDLFLYEKNTFLRFCNATIKL
jgi:hypothetical protein